MTPSNAFATLKQLGFDVKLNWCILGPGITTGTTMANRICDYRAVFKSNSGLVCLTGLVYVVGREPCMTMQVYSSYKISIDSVISDVTQDNLIQLAAITNEATHSKRNVGNVA